MTIASYVQVRQAIVIVVSDCNRHPPPTRGQTRFLCDVRKMDRGRIAVLVVKRNHQVATSSVLLNGRVVDYCYNQLSIIVTVKQGYPAASHRLQNITPVFPGIGHGCDSHLRGNVTKGYMHILSGICFGGRSFLRLDGLDSREGVLRANTNPGLKACQYRKHENKDDAYSSHEYPGL